MNRLMPHDVRVLSVEAAPENFHARFSATAKTYHYHLWLSPVDCPFRQNYHYHIWTPVDRALLASSAAALVGRHNFFAFANNTRNAVEPNPVRTIRRFDLIPEGEGDAGLRFEVEGTGFLYRQVRNMVRAGGGGEGGTVYSPLVAGPFFCLPS